MPTPISAILSALTLLAIVLPVALTVWAFLHARRNWRSWLIYSPPAPHPDASSARPTGPAPEVPDLQEEARKGRLSRHSSQRLPAQSRTGAGPSGARAERTPRSGTRVERAKALRKETDR